MLDTVVFFELLKLTLPDLRLAFFSFSFWPVMSDRITSL